jgi:hypothetical protein
MIDRPIIVIIIWLLVLEIKWFDCGVPISILFFLNSDLVIDSLILLENDF